jgi:hypothetical protein
MLPKLRAFLKTRKEKGPVEISGKKMTASYRFVFPSERIWRKALAPTAHEQRFASSVTETTRLEGHPGGRKLVGLWRARVGVLHDASRGGVRGRECPGDGVLRPRRKVRRGDPKSP